MPHCALYPPAPCKPTADCIVCGSMAISNNSLKQISVVLAQFIFSFQYNSCTRFAICSLIDAPFQKRGLTYALCLFRIPGFAIGNTGNDLSSALLSLENQLLGPGYSSRMTSRRQFVQFLLLHGERIRRYLKSSSCVPVRSKKAVMPFVDQMINQSPMFAT